jgi:hypothetical protein
MIQRSVLAASLSMAFLLGSGASLAQTAATTPAPAKQATAAQAKAAKAAQAKAATVPAATQAVKPAATMPSTATEDRRYKSCHDKESDA